MQAQHHCVMLSLRAIKFLRQMQLLLFRPVCYSDKEKLMEITCYFLVSLFHQRYSQIFQVCQSAKTSTF